MVPVGEGQGLLNVAGSWLSGMFILRGGMGLARFGGLGSLWGTGITIELVTGF